MVSTHPDTHPFRIPLRIPFFEKKLPRDTSKSKRTTFEQCFFLGAEISAFSKMAAFIYGLDNPDHIQKWKEPDSAESEGPKRPGKKPARSDEQLLIGFDLFWSSCWNPISTNLLIFLNPRRPPMNWKYEIVGENETKKGKNEGEKWWRSKSRNSQSKLRSWKSKMLICHGDLYEILTFFFYSKRRFQIKIRKYKSIPQELDIENLIRQRDQIVATFIRQSWAQEIIKKTERINNNPSPKVSPTPQPKPIETVCQNPKIMLVRFNEQEQAQLAKSKTKKNH